MSVSSAKNVKNKQEATAVVQLLWKGICLHHWTAGEVPGTFFKMPAASGLAESAGLGEGSHLCERWCFLGFSSSYLWVLPPAVRTVSRVWNVGSTAPGFSNDPTGILGALRPLVAFRAPCTLPPGFSLALRGQYKPQRFSPRYCRRAQFLLSARPSRAVNNPKDGSTSYVFSLLLWELL